MERSTWVEVSRAALTANYAAVAAHATVPVCAVVKANAYGHGLVPAARTFIDAGAAMLGVARIEEARALRAAQINADILILMPVPDAQEAVALGCAITVGSEDAINSVPPDARAHLKIDTGMGRLGIHPSDAVHAARAISARATLAGVWTHFADGADGAMQLHRFEAVVRALRASGIDAPIHASNSAAMLAVPGARFDLVRIGTLLYGQHPAGVRAPFPLQETFAWRARVAAVRTVPAGATVGYGSEWTASRPTRIATIPVGWADGFTVEPHPRTPSVKQTAMQMARTARRATTDPRAVLFGERRAPVIGRVAMQAITVSLEDLDDIDIDIDVGAIATLEARRLMVSADIERVYS